MTREVNMPSPDHIEILKRLNALEEQNKKQHAVNVLLAKKFTELGVGISEIIFTQQPPIPNSQNET